MLKHIYQECPMEWQRWLIHVYSMRERLKMQAEWCDKYCKQQYSKKALFWYNLNPKGMIIFPYDDKQFILLTCMGNNNP